MTVSGSAAGGVVDLGITLAPVLCARSGGTSVLGGGTPMAGNRRERTKHDLRCFCSRAPLLAVYGVDEKGRLYIHQRVYKAGRVFGESFFYGGTIKLLCRECLRWNEVVFRDRDTVDLREVEAPEVLAHEAGLRDSLPVPDLPV